MLLESIIGREEPKVIAKPVTKGFWEFETSAAITSAIIGTSLIALIGIIWAVKKIKVKFSNKKVVIGPRNRLYNKYTLNNKNQSNANQPPFRTFANLPFEQQQNNTRSRSRENNDDFTERDIETLIKYGAISNQDAQSWKIINSKLKPSPIKFRKRI